MHYEVLRREFGGTYDIDVPSKLGQGATRSFTMEELQTYASLCVCLSTQADTQNVAWLVLKLDFEHPLNPQHFVGVVFSCCEQ